VTNPKQDAWTGYSISAGLRIYREAGSAHETMPTDAYRFFYDCSGCGTLLRPKPGEGSLSCSYGVIQHRTGDPLLIAAQVID
jgi:hypothetical protein